MVRQRVVSVIFAASLLVFSALYADVIILKNGQKIEGKIRGETAENVVIEYEAGQLKKVQQFEIQSIERKPFEFAGKANEKDPKTERSPQAEEKGGISAGAKRKKSTTADDRKTPDAGKSSQSTQKPSTTATPAQSSLPLADGVTPEEDAKAQEAIKKKNLYFYLGTVECPSVCPWSTGISGRVRVWKGRKYSQPEAALACAVWVPGTIETTFTYFSQIKEQGEWMSFGNSPNAFGGKPRPTMPCPVKVLIYGTTPVRRMGKIHNDPVMSKVISNTIDLTVRFQ
jgi:hypothetical protein